jgi:hypothetical protein
VNTAAINAPITLKTSACVAIIECHESIVSSL